MQARCLVISLQEKTYERQISESFIDYFYPVQEVFQKAHSKIIIPFTHNFVFPSQFTVLKLQVNPVLSLMSFQAQRFNYVVLAAYISIWLFLSVTYCFCNLIVVYLSNNGEEYTRSFIYLL